MLGRWQKNANLLRDLSSLVDEFIDEGIPLTEPGFGDLEADTQRAIEESLKDAHGATSGPLPPCWCSLDTDTGKSSTTSRGRGQKERRKSVSRSLLNLQISNRKEPTKQYIFQRMTRNQMRKCSIVKSGCPDEKVGGPNPGIQDEKARLGQTLEANNEKATADTEVGINGCLVTIHSKTLLLSSYGLHRLGELEQHITNLVDANQALEERLDKHGSRLYRLENQDIPNQSCSKHMTGDRSRLRNFVKKFIGTVRFRNDHFGAIMGYGDYVIGDSILKLPSESTHASSET
ncbi:hypothetical protein Tco_0232284 [Tanacetum coccineum]